MDRIVPDDAARVIVSEPDRRAKRDAPCAVEKGVALDQRVTRSIRHQQRGPRELPDGRDDVAKHVAADYPSGAAVHIDAGPEEIPRGRRVLEQRALDESVGRTDARQVGAAPDEWLTRV